MKLENNGKKTVNVCDLCGRRIPYLAGTFDYGFSIEDDVWNLLVKKLKLPKEGGFLCYECLLKSLFKYGFNDIFEVAKKDSNLNNILFHRAYLETENINYSFSEKSGNKYQFRLEFNPSEEQLEKNLKPFTIDFHSFKNLMHFSQYLCDKLNTIDTMKE